MFQVQKKDFAVQVNMEWEVFTVIVTHLRNGLRWFHNTEGDQNGTTPFALAPPPRSRRPFAGFVRASADKEESAWTKRVPAGTP